MTVTLPAMPKKKKRPSVKKEVLYVEIDADLKQELVDLAERNSRKISAEALLAIRHWLKLARERGEEEP